MTKIKKYTMLLLILAMLCGCANVNTAEPPIPQINETAEVVTAQPAAEDELSTDMNQITWDDGNFPLYAMIKDEDIYLYGVNPYGMVLYQNGKGTYFEWPGLTPRGILPQLLYYDLDGDGKKELAVTLYWGSGTGVSMMDLHILSIVENEKYGWEKPEYTDYSLLANDANIWMKEKITTTLSDDKNTFTLDFCGESYAVECYNDTESGEFIGIGFGDIVDFYFEGSRIKTKIALGALYENFATMQYFGDIEAYVTFDGEKITLEDYTFSLTNDGKIQ